MQEDEGYSSATVNEEAASASAGNREAPAGKEPPTAEAPAKRIARQLIGLALAAVFLYWAFKGQDLGNLWKYARETDLKFLALVVISGLASHLLRAWRWILLLKPLSPKPISLWNSFCAVMYGYAVNVVLPRGGEVARLVSISKSESIPWAGVLPTMFIDRLLDIAMLVLLVGLTVTRLPTGILDARLTGPAGLAMCAAVVFGLAILPFVSKIGRGFLSIEPVKKAIPESLFSRVDRLLEQFDLGTRALTSVTNLLAIALFSLLIWVCYFANTVLILAAFHLENVVDLSKALVVFAVSSVSVLIPTPGCVGSYHLFTSQALQKVAGVNETESLAFAAVTHLICFIIITCVPAAVCLALQSSSSGKAKS
jgi:glycosyltransferase 2 family protein